MNALTVKDLYKMMLHEMQLGRQDYTVLVTDDDEANGYHYLWYGPQTITEAEKPMEIDGKTYTETIQTSDNVAPHEKHIIIG